MRITQQGRAERDAGLKGLPQRLIEYVAALVPLEDWRRALEFAARFRSSSFLDTTTHGIPHVCSWASRVPGGETGEVVRPTPSANTGQSDASKLRDSTPSDPSAENKPLLGPPELDRDRSVRSPSRSMVGA